MSQRSIAAFPPPPQARAAAARPSAPSVGETLVATPGEASGRSSVAETLAATADPSSSAETLAAEGGTSAAPVAAGRPRSIHDSALPEVRTEGGALVLVPRKEIRYERHELLGRGGMGEVELAHDNDIDRKVAIKRMLDPKNAHAVARFIDEVRTVGNLEHPNIVPIHDVGVDEHGAPFFVMKYVEGETLASIIDRLAAGDAEYHARYTFEHRQDLFAGLLRALHYAHSRGLVHRDVKPENVMVGRYGEVILMDWGITHRIRDEAANPASTGGAVEGSSGTNDAGPSRTTARSAAGSALPTTRAAAETVDGAVVGTPQYMSPEQAAGQVRDLDGRSDLYSAFVVLWELLTLTPYVAPGKTAMQTVLAVQARPLPSMIDPAFLHPHQGAVPAELRHYLRRGLQPDRDARFVDAQQALVELEHVRSGDFAAQCAVTFMKRNNTRMERFMDRHPIGSLWLAGACAGLAVFGLLGWLAVGLSAFG